MSNVISYTAAKIDRLMERRRERLERAIEPKDPVVLHCDCGSAIFHILVSGNYRCVECEAEFLRDDIGFLP